MEICVLGSSSAGNCTLVKTASTAILIDIGFSLRYTTKTLERIGVPPESIDAVLITHEHTDHIRGAEPFFRRYRVPFVMNALTYQNADLRVVPAIFENFKEFIVKDLRIIPVTVPHDSSNPVAYRIEGDKKVGMATDLGFVDFRLRSYFTGLDAYVFESNHDKEMLIHGRYPPFLKERITSNYGHLSNTQCGDALKEMSTGAEIFLAHMSENNNTPQKATETVDSIVGSDFTVHLTSPQKESAMVAV
jgi:phosphoribosyl 1,2-cyclic phosphodiesterase